MSDDPKQDEKAAPPPASTKSQDKRVAMQRPAPTKLLSEQERDPDKFLTDAEKDRRFRHGSPR